MILIVKKNSTVFIKNWWKILSQNVGGFVRGGKIVISVVGRNKYHLVWRQRFFLRLGSKRREAKGGCACPERRITSPHWSIRGFHGRESSICSPLTFVSGTEHAPMELGPLQTFYYLSFRETIKKKEIIESISLFLSHVPLSNNLFEWKHSYSRVITIKHNL